MAILSKGCKADNFESHSSLKLSFTRPSFQFCWMWIFPWTKLSWYSCPEWDELGWFSWFWQFLFEGLSSFNLKRCFTCMHGLVVYMKEGLTFALTKSLENSADAFWCFDLIYFSQCLTSFSSINHLYCGYEWFLILFHLTQMRFSWSTHLLMCLIHHKDWLTYSCGADRSGQLCYNFSISNDLDG